MTPSKLIKVQDSVYYIQIDAGSIDFQKSYSAALADSLRRLRELHARKAHIRVVKDSHYAVAAEAVSESGFSRISERIEFASPVESLPSEHGSPLTWRPLESKSEPDLRHAAGTLERCAQGDRDWSLDDDFYQHLSGYLDDPSLNGGPDCVHLGSIGGHEAAIVVAQVRPATGWSRITYMGLAPELRGQGLGRWVHRHGFAMLKAQGGKTYVGGTLAGNLAMISLFRVNGCRETRRLEEWAAELDHSDYRTSI